MGFPLIPFAAGLAVGALATYGSREAAVQKQIKRGADYLVSGTARVYGMMVAGLGDVAGRLGFGAAEPEVLPLEQPQEEAAAEQKSEAAAPRKRTRTKRTATATRQGGAATTRKTPSKTKASKA